MPAVPYHARHAAPVGARRPSPSIVGAPGPTEPEPAAPTIEDDIRAGRTVIANVSRTVIPQSRNAYANVVVVSITAPADVLAERLAMRRRGSDGNIAERLARTVEDAEPDATIVNVGSAEYHARQLLRIVAGAAWDD